MALFDWEQVHEQIVRETFVSLDAERAAALVGILSDYVIDYSDELRAVVAALRRDLEQHRFVGRLSPASELP